MQIEKNLKTLSLSLIIFALPFVDFVKNNFDELDIIIGKSFYFLIIILGFILIIFSYAIIFIFKKIDFKKALLIIVLFFWFFFKHNLLNLQIKKFLEKFNIISIEYSSEISLIILVILSIWFSILIYKKNLFLRRFLYIFHSFFFTSIIQISFFEKKQS